MSRQYKRSICVMCPVKDTCDGLRWMVPCGACPTSLKCAAGPGVGRVDCKKLQGTWLGLPRKCLLVAGLVNSKANENKNHFIQEDDSEQALICPRCKQGRGHIYVDHALNYMFRRETTYIYTCDYCGVDETVRLA